MRAGQLNRHRAPRRQTRPAAANLSVGGWRSGPPGATSAARLARWVAAGRTGGARPGVGEVRAGVADDQEDSMVIQSIVPAK